MDVEKAADIKQNSPETKSATATTLMSIIYRKGWFK